MNKDSRRTFIASIIGASALTAVQGCDTATTVRNGEHLSKGSNTVKPPENMPLTIDLIGPMAFSRNSAAKSVDVWLPDLRSIGSTPHQAGITTAAGSLLFLDPGSKVVDCSITGPTVGTTTPVPYGTNGCKIYTVPAPTASPKPYLHLTVPMPQGIVALFPVFCNIFPTSSPPPTTCLSSYAVGLRFIYLQAGKTTLIMNSVSKLIPFDPSSDEQQLSLQVQYVPVNYSNDLQDDEAIKAFNLLSKLFPPLDLTVDFETCLKLRPDMTMSTQGFHGPLKNCKAPIILAG